MLQYRYIFSDAKRSVASFVNWYLSCSLYQIQKKEVVKYTLYGNENLALTFIILWFFNL